MAFDISSAEPVNQGFDISTASPVGDTTPASSGDQLSLGDLGLGLVKGATLGTAPYFGAVAHMLPQSLGGPGLSYGEGLKEEKARYAQSEAEHPLENAIGSVIGGAPAALETGVGSMPAIIGKGALVGATQSAANSDSIPSALLNAPIGGAIGGLANTIIPGASKAVDLVKTPLGRNALANSLQKAVDNPDIQSKILQNMQEAAQTSSKSGNPRFTVNTPEDVHSSWFRQAEAPKPILGVEPGTPQYDQLVKSNPDLAPRPEGQVHQLIRDLRNSNKSVKDIQQTLTDNGAKLPLGMLNRTINETIPGWIPGMIEGGMKGASKWATMPTESLMTAAGMLHGGLGEAVAGAVAPAVMGAGVGGAGAIANRSLSRDMAAQLAARGWQSGYPAMNAIGSSAGQLLSQTPWAN